MLRYGVDDLRLFFDGDLRFLRSSTDRTSSTCSFPNPGCASSATRRSTTERTGRAADHVRPGGRRAAPGRAAVHGVVVGEVLDGRAAPERRPAERLQGRCRHAAAPLQIVCGAPNVRAGIKVPCALVGAELPPGEDGKPFAIKSASCAASRARACCARRASWSCPTTTAACSSCPPMRRVGQRHPRAAARSTTRSSRSSSRRTWRIA